MEQAEEAAAEAEAEGSGRFGLEGEGCVVEFQLLQRGAQFLVLVGLCGVDAREEHRFHLLEALDGGLAGARHVGDGVAHTHLRGGLDAGNQIAHVAGRERVLGHPVHLEDANLVGVILVVRGEELHHLVGLDGAVEDAEIGDDAAEGVEHGVEDEGLQRGIRVALGGGDALDDGLEHLLHALSRLTGGLDDVGLVAAEQVDNLVLDLQRHCGGHIHLVEHRDNLQVIVDGLVEVGDGLGLHALGGVHQQQGALAGGDGTRHLVGEVHVARRVDEVQDVCLAVIVVLHLDGVALDGDATLTLQIHIVEHLILELAVVYGFGILEKTVGQRALSVVDMRNYAEISNIFHKAAKIRKKSVAKKQENIFFSIRFNRKKYIFAAW